nr:immunoglobulin light chain junction region [Macaca mulatta]MOX42373.1 immunoglobulin light chain junction region [Macaca mulatta]MOX42638.1 immunoglobulin light chain junction region [Macaca mulatta]MOX42857.1 immunoglobulin light chain junction region [Macaca mulatta]MOX44943.1 immunoglobulin light chain junction region [Macaca mulatta]
DYSCLSYDSSLSGYIF